MKIWVIKTLLGLVALGCVVAAQSKPECASVTAALEQRLDAQRRLLMDWAGLIRYGSENTEIPRPAPGEDRVVFLAMRSQNTGAVATRSSFRAKAI